MTEITVHVRYFNILADYAGTKRAEMRLAEGSTVRSLLETLLQTSLAPLRQSLQRSGEDFNSLRVFLNGEIVTGNQLAQPVRDGDEFMLSPAIAGG